MANDHDPTSREPARPPTDYRAMRRRNDRSLFLAVIAVLLVVGGGLIYIIYGTGALITGLACLLFGVGILLLLWLIMSAIERWANR
jgi:protein-S-isoprenylcysteine O-methyltransferase Ste14